MSLWQRRKSILKLSIEFRGFDLLKLFLMTELFAIIMSYVLNKTDDSINVLGTFVLCSIPIIMIGGFIVLLYLEVRKVFDEAYREKELQIKYNVLYKQFLSR